MWGEGRGSTQLSEMVVSNTHLSVCDRAGETKTSQDYLQVVLIANRLWGVNKNRIEKTNKVSKICQAEVGYAGVKGT